MAENSDNSGMGVIVGILIAVVLIVGGYFFLKNEGCSVGGSTTNIEMPDVKVEAPDAPAPASN